MAGPRGGLRLFHRLSLLRSVHHRSRARRRRDARHTGLSPQRRARLRPNQPLRPVWPSLRRDRRRGAAGRAGAGGADGLPARHAVDSRRRRLRRRSAGHDRPLLLDPTRRKIARRDDPRRNGPGRRQRRRRRHSADQHHSARRARARGGQRAEGQPVGHVHRVLHGSDRADHGTLRPLLAPGADRRNVGDRRRSAARRAGLRQDRRRNASARRLVHLHRAATGADGGRLRLRRLGAAGVAAARAARLSVDLHQGRRDSSAGDRRADRPSRPADALGDEVHRRNRPGLVGRPLPLPVHHHRLRRRVGLARADLFGNDAEDDRERAPDPFHRLRRDADGIVRRHHGDGRRVDDPARRLFRHEQRRRTDRRRRGARRPGDLELGLRRHAGYAQPGRARRRRNRRSCRAPAARRRWRSAWRTSCRASSAGRP